MKATEISVPPEPAPSLLPAGVDRSELASSLQHAKFLVKAKLAPLAVDTLRKIVREAPGTPLAREAEQMLNSIGKDSREPRVPPAP